ncbi:hypothetical protein L198_02496 [Cryptococcus wingfieldii CBS 7118]|uniref:Uncharacterized protein n=1 Tax=Cryptococcus wingfieldii CBS 7118 TaxID=1295528 RepID=A0A1E3JS37_9TREE|nr:hypothetical protein L198_02496 [Cryptococcus wingfieldii CBS 7118]ODO03645.1 hypothetical protein L198_02496 [Cryptococcus wingfieldii CBS 7118]
MAEPRTQDEIDAQEAEFTQYMNDSMTTLANTFAQKATSIDADLAVIYRRQTDDWRESKLDSMLRADLASNHADVDLTCDFDWQRGAPYTADENNGIWTGWSYGEGGYNIATKFSARQ